MGGPIPIGGWFHPPARLAQLELEVLALRAERDELRRHLTAAVKAGFSLAQELAQAAPKPPEDPLHRAIRQAHTGLSGPL